MIRIEAAFKFDERMKKMRYNEFDEKYYEESMDDTLLDYIRFMHRSNVKVLNFERYILMCEAVMNLKLLFRELGEENCIFIEIIKEFNVGTVTVELTDFSIKNIKLFFQVILNADSFEIYPLTNGNIRLDITFQSVLKSV